MYSWSDSESAIQAEDCGRDAGANDESETTAEAAVEANTVQDTSAGCPAVQRQETLDQESGLQIPEAGAGDPK